MNNNNKKIAIIGSGISGMGAAYALHKAGHAITMFEANHYIGGHSRTVDIVQSTESNPVDSGYIVFNHRNYPHLTKLFDHLSVATEKSDMSFGVDIKGGWLQYSSNNMFNRPANLKRLSYWRMLLDILRFNKKAPAILEKNPSMSISALIKTMKLGQWFQDYYLQAMGAAIWSTPAAKIEDFPARTFIKFFQNHGLMTVNNQPQWYTVTGGSREYVKKITADFKENIHLNCPVQSVEQKGDKILITHANGTDEFDEVVFACHADQALKMVNTPTKQQKDILGAFSYQENKIVIHSDESFMPADKNCWASWVYLSNGTEDEKDVSLTYWMNNLQNLETPKPILITLNPATMPRSTKDTHDIHHFRHPIFDEKAIQAQEKIKEIQGVNNMWFVGAYQRYGFHEDGLLSAVRVLEKMGVDLPWT